MLKQKTMKKLKLAFMLLVGLIIISCSNNGDETPPIVESKFTIEGTDYSTPNGYMYSGPSDDENYSYHAIFLLNGTIPNNSTKIIDILGITTPYLLPNSTLSTLEFL